MRIGTLAEAKDRLVLAGVLLYAAVASLTTPLTSAATVAVLLPCGAALGLALVRRTSGDRRMIRGRLSGVTLAWAALAALTVIWDLVAWLQQPTYNIASADHPTISLLLDPLTESGLPRFLLWCLWLYVGYRLVRR